MFLRGATAGLSDYVGAAGKYVGDKIGTAIKPGDAPPLSYNDALKEVRGDVSQYTDQNPVKGYGSEIAGAVTSPLFRGAGKVAEAGVNTLTRASPRLAQSVAQGAGRFLGYGAQGAAQGALAGAGTAQGQGGGLPSGGDVARATGVGAAGGAALGVAVPALAEGGAKVIGRIAGTLAKKPPAMTQDQFKTAAQAGYKAAEDAGVHIKPESFQRFVASLPGELNGFHPKVTPGASNIVSALQEEAAKGPVTLSTLDKLRSIASGASISRDANEARLAGNIAAKIDDFVESIQADDLLAGASKAADAVESLTNARSLWKTYSKMKTISDIVDTGEHLNDMNWVKGRFRAIVKKPAVFNRYTPDEQAVIAEIAKTGTLEKIAKLIPWRGIQMTTTYAEPVAQARKIGALQDLIARGGNRPAPPRMSPMASALIGRSTVPAMSPLASSLMTGGSNQRP